MVQRELAAYAANPKMKLSSDDELAAPIGVSSGTVYNDLRALLPQDLRKLREGILREQNRRASNIEAPLLLLVGDEIRAHRIGGAQLSTEVELAVRFSCHESSIRRVMRSLNQEDMEYWRANVDRPDGRSERRIEIGVVVFAREELEQRRKRQVLRVSTEEELATRFQVDPGVVFRRLREAGRGLSEMELNERLDAIKRQSAEKQKGLRHPRAAELVQSLKDEIALYRRKQLPQVRHNDVLMRDFEMKPGTFRRCLLQLSQTDRRDRLKALRRQTNALTFQKHGSPLEKVSSQTKKEAAKQAAKTRRERGVNNFAGLTDEQRHSNAKAAHRTKATRYTSEQRAEWGKRAREASRRILAVRYLGVLYDSQQEAAVAHLLKRHLGFQILPGKTHQVPLDGRRFDFKLGDLYLEWHPSVLCKKERKGHFPCDDSYDEYLKTRSSANTDETKAVFTTQVSDSFLNRYRKARRQILDSAGIATASLICVRSLPQLYEEVLAPLATQIPPLKTIQREFDSLVKDVRLRGESIRKQKG
jgi:hypothetical protein